MNTQNKKILIVGAGITGLSLAIMCEKYGIAYDLVEKASKFHPQGYSVTIPPAGMRALRTLGIEDAIRSVARRVDGVLLATSEGRAIDFGGSNLDVMTVRRTDLHATLLAKVEQPIRYDTTLHVNEALSDTYSLIVGADGLHSRVRAHMFPEYQPQPTGVAFWTCFVPDELYGCFSSTHITQYWRGGNFAGIFPLPGGASIVLSTHLPPSMPISNLDITSLFANMPNEIREVLARVSQPSVYSGHLHEVKLPRWQKYPYALVGDAAHAMMPATGMGSAAGMLDAIKLAELLVSHEDRRKALRYYHSARALSAHSTQATSRLITRAMLATGVRGSLNQKAAQLLPDSFFIRVFR